MTTHGNEDLQLQPPRISSSPYQDLYREIPLRPNFPAIGRSSQQEAEAENK